ncbi:MAG: DUF192 domain-containing protein [Tepidisphaeraceae bacterium]
MKHRTMNAMQNRPIAAKLVLSIALLAAGCDAAPPASAPAGPQPQSLPTTPLTLAGKSFTVQVADDDKEREIGLMYTRSMPEDRGMIFVFPVERPLSFWMRNTPIDLDIIYADRTGKVVAVKTMHAYDESGVPSEEPASIAIELNAGVAAKLKIVAGQKIDLPENLFKDAR